MAEVCSTCQLVHKENEQCLSAQRRAMEALLHNIGSSGICRGCRSPVIWVTHKNLKPTPYTSAGLNHFIDCPAATMFKEPR